MLNYKATIVSTLNTILPTYYELFCDSSTPLPCITYIEGDNSSMYEGDTIRFSDLRFTIKVWDDDIGHASNIASQIDTKMKELGFRRYSSNELVVKTNIVKIMNYTGIAFEEATLEQEDN